MATNAEGTAETGLSMASSGGALRRKPKTASCKTHHAMKDKPTKRSARVSCRLLSCQKRTATAPNSSAAGTTTVKLKRCSAFATDQAPSTTAAALAPNFQGLRWAYSCAPKKKNTAAIAYSQRSRAVCSGVSGTHCAKAAPK